MESNIALKSCNTIPSTGLTCIAYVPSSKTRRTTNIVKQIRKQQEQKQEFTSKGDANKFARTRTIDSLLEIDSSDEEENTSEENLSLNDSSINVSENHLHNEQQDTRQATVWLGTRNGGYTLQFRIDSIFYLR